MRVFKGNKQSLPVRYCKNCKKPMTWRKNGKSAGIRCSTAPNAVAGKQSAAPTLTRRDAEKRNGCSSHKHATIPQQNDNGSRITLYGPNIATMLIGLLIGNVLLILMRIAFKCVNCRV